MNRNARYSVALGLAVFLATAVSAAQQPQTVPEKPQTHEHQAAEKTQPSDMAAKCKAMMAQHEKMMSDMKAADQRLDSLVSKMNAASAQAKVDAIAAAVSEIVAQRHSMRESMMHMHMGMMSHMADHMQSGTMAMCPMMKSMASGKH